MLSPCRLRLWYDETDVNRVQVGSADLRTIVKVVKTEQVLCICLSEFCKHSCEALVTRLQREIHGGLVVVALHMITDEQETEEVLYGARVPSTL
jgi:hypothetical protein